MKPKYQSFQILKNKVNRLKNIDKIIKETLFSMLREQSEKSDIPQSDAGDKNPSPAPRSNRSNVGVISTAGAFGSGGRAKSFVTSAGSRAKEDPEGLLNDLGIYRKFSGGDLDTVLEVLRKAIHSNVVMAEAYEGAKISNEPVKVKDREVSKKVISVTLKELDRKNGIRFLAHTLKAAQNADYLNLKSGLQFGQSTQSDIVIYEF